MKCFHFFILLLILLLISNISLSHADGKENMAKNAVVYSWGDVLAINAHLDKTCSANEIKEISSYIKYHIYYQYNLKRFPVCVINYFVDKKKLMSKVDPWEIKGWKYQYVINKQMKQEFLYTVVKGKIKRIQ